MTWLDVGNGWRNVYLLSCLLQATGLGSLFAARRWFVRRSRAACFLTGVAVTPFVQYLWTLVLAFFWPHAPRLVYIGALPALAAVCLLTLGLCRFRRALALLGRGWRFIRRVCRFEKPALVALCFALCVVILLLPVCVRFSSSMNAVGGGDAGEYMALALRYCEERDVGALLEKEEAVGHFRGHSHFPSLELYMSYGLFHAGGELGYPYDKPAFFGLGLLVFFMLAAYLALLLAFCRERKAWVLLGVVLFNLVPNLYDSVALAPRDLWRILALFLAALAFMGLEPRGNGKQYLGKLALSFGICFTAMSAHVVCFVTLPFIVVAWVIWRWLEALMSGSRGAGRTLAASLGIALAGAAGTVTAFAGNLWCYAKWGEMSPWRLMTTYTGAPWYDMYMDIEYKLEETTTHVNFWQAKDDILLSYATPIGQWGLWLALAALVGIVVWVILCRLRMRRTARALAVPPAQDGPTSVAVRLTGLGTRRASTLLFCSLLTLCLLAPMTGLLDSPLYSFSGAFSKLPRYTLQWFLLAGVMCCAALAAVSDLWPELCGWCKAHMPKLHRRLDTIPSLRALKPYVKRLPAYLCALLCALGLAQGTKQTGYAASFYRDSRHVMESESILLDNGFRERYGLLMEVAAHVPENEKILITRVGYQYALKAKGYVLTANPIVPLMNLPLEEVGAALESMNVAMLATEPTFWDGRYYALSTLNEYLSALPPEQIIETPSMRLYLLNRSLIPIARSAAGN